MIVPAALAAGNETSGCSTRTANCHSALWNCCWRHCSLLASAVSSHINFAGRIMKTYRVYSHPNRPVPMVVKVGFSWPAFIIGPLWFLVNKMWLNFAIVTAFIVSANLYFHHFKPSSQGEKLLDLGMALLALVGWFLIGKFANLLLCSDLEGRGYVLQATVKAKSTRTAREEFAKMSPSHEAPAT